MAQCNGIINQDKLYIDGQVLTFEETANLLSETKRMFDECNAEKTTLLGEIKELQEQNSILESELETKENLEMIRCALSKDSKPSIEWYEERYQSDCITINQLHTTIDVLTDKLARLRGQMGL